jgi:macrolide transport system ATP-binding/permease protein
MRIEHWWFTPRLRFRSILRRRRVEQELTEELQFHLEHKIEEGIAAGLSPQEARYLALRAMQGLEQRKEEMRDTQRIHWWTDFIDDVHYALRALRRTTGLTAFVVLTVALGIGMASATFSMLDALIFRLYPVPHPGNVVTLVSTTHDKKFDYFSYREYLDIRGKTKSYDGVIASADLATVGFSGRPGVTPRVKGGMLVSANYFHVLGVEPQLGRGFREQEDHVPGRDPVVVLASKFWKSEFGATAPSWAGRFASTVSNSP